MTEYKRPVPSILTGKESFKEKRHKNPKKHESYVAKSLGGNRQIASGAFDRYKGDVDGVGNDAFDFLIECKTTSNESLRITVEWLNKITKEAGVNKYPALAIRFEEAVMRRVAENKSNGVEAEKDWIAVPLSVFKKMVKIDFDYHFEKDKENK